MSQDYSMPVDTMISLVRYRDHHIPTGGFLRLVLENDLMGAMGKADLRNRASLFDICSFVYNEMPCDSHGDKESVARWLGELPPLPDPAHRCSVCHKNWVDSDNGHDTCDDCLGRI